MVIFRGKRTPAKNLETCPVHDAPCVDIDIEGRAPNPRGLGPAMLSPTEISMNLRWSCGCSAEFVEHPDNTDNLYIEFV